MTDGNKILRSFKCSGCYDVESPCIITLTAYDDDDAKLIIPPKICPYHAKKDVTWTDPSNMIENISPL